jgi:uncharacterized protein YceK
MKLAVVTVAALLLVSGCAAQNNFTRTDSGIPHSADATAQSKQLTVAANGGCATFTYVPGKEPGFNYSAGLGVPTTLPGDCKLTDLTITKQYVAGACPDTRANNYAVSSLNIVNKCGDGITATDTATCNDVINKAPEEAKAASGLGQGDIVDTGKTCWEAPTVFYFVKNDCATAIPVTIKVYFDTYFGTCVKADDTDDGGDDVGGAVPSSGGGGLSSGAKAGIAIGVIAGVALIAGIIFFAFCQLRK